ncbi:hypothetical protein I7I50_04503 [Histoplasma capsulatum G186AR]|uniref:Uncharacterized protein n=1 Tax=Ajellomyces capsulatus TaxID=5037 RepID=A0A8H8CY16_AJECA|nr:hypothetical protein I7I52_05412 [Histoplasma capsulatum]QSS75379.1 hypothetical protein I7I50_04503 [Histoplasma capsulatum G186AR]
MMPLPGQHTLSHSGLAPPSPGNSAMRLRFQNVRRGVGHDGVCISRCSKRCSSFFCRDANGSYCFLNAVNELVSIPRLSAQTIHHISASEKDGHQERYAETGARCSICRAAGESVRCFGYEQHDVEHDANGCYVLEK